MFTKRRAKRCPYATAAPQHEHSQGFKIDSERALIRTFRRHHEFSRPIPQRGGNFVGRQIVPYHFHCGDGFLKGNRCGGREHFQRERRRRADLKFTYSPARNRFGRLARRALALSGDAIYLEDQISLRACPFFSRSASWSVR